jgi:hypothetical protein
MEEEVKFFDESFKSQHEKLTFRMICLEHLKKIGTIASKEYRGGYNQSKIHHIGNYAYKEDVYIPDTREEYSNAIDYLHDILYPHFDSEMNEADGKLNNELGEIKKDLDNYKDLKLEIKRKLFINLNSFLFRIKYLQGKVFEEEVGE